MLEDGDMGPEATKGANAAPEPSSAETEPEKKDGRAVNGGANFKVRSDDKRGGAQPTKEVADESPPDKRTKRGVPKGQKVLTSSDIRAALSRRSGAVDVLVRVLKGEQFQTTGPTGKTVMSYPSVGERLSAVRMVLERTCPTRNRQPRMRSRMRTCCCVSWPMMAVLHFVLHERGQARIGTTLPTGSATEGSGRGFRISRR